jgi:hypothetical protein
MGVGLGTTGLQTLRGGLVHAQGLLDAFAGVLAEPLAGKEPLD